MEKSVQKHLTFVIDSSMGALEKMTREIKPKHDEAVRKYWRETQRRHRVREKTQTQEED
jgi:hypothetical protein